MKSGSYYFVSW